MNTKAARSLIDLDHPMLKVNNPSAARKAYQRLGFTVSPFRSNDPMGGGSTGGAGGNHLVMLTPQSPQTTNMIELAYCDRDHAWPALKTLLGGSQGLALLVHSPSDVDKIQQEWVDAGIPCDPVFEVKTRFDDPETDRVDTIHFRVAQPSQHDWRYSFGAAQIYDFSHYLRDDWCTHENTALFWSDISLFVPDDEIEFGRSYLEKVYGQRPEPDADGRLIYKVNRLSLSVLPNSLVAQTYSGIPLETSDAEQCHTALSVVVQDMTRLREVLARRQVKTYEKDASVFVAPSDACGVLLRFIEAV